MATITTRAGKGSPLTNTEVDDNFSNLNSAKYESGANPVFGNVSLASTAGIAERYISIGSSSIDTNAYAYIDFVGDDTHTDYGLRLMRGNSGPNTNSSIQHRGTGNFFFDLQNGSNAVIFNENSHDTDFRVESNSNANQLFVDAGNSLTYVGSNTTTTTPSANGFGVKAGGEKTVVLESTAADTLLLFRDSGTTTPPYIGSFGDDLAISGYGGGTPNVGIGITAPQSAFHINENGGPQSSGDMTTGLIVSNGSAGTAMQMGTNDASGFGFIKSAYVNSAQTGRPLLLYTGTTKAVSVESGETVLNDDSLDRDFRVESDSNTHMLFVDASTNRVGIGMSAPESLLHLYETSSATGQITLSTLFNGAEHNAGRIGWTHASGWDTTISLGTASNHTDSYRDELIINKNYVVINEDSNDMDFRVESDSNANMFFVDAGNNRVAVGTATPDVPFHVSSSLTDIVKLTTESTTVGPNLLFANTDGTLARLASAETNTLRIETGTSNTEIARFVEASGAVFNEDGNDLDFRVESNDNTHMLFVDAGNNRVGVGSMSTPEYTLDVGADLGSGATLFRLGNTNGTYSQSIEVDFASNKDVGFTTASGNGGLSFDTGSRGFLFNDQQTDTDFKIATVDRATAFHVDAATDTIYLNSKESEAGSRFTVNNDGSGTGHLQFQTALNNQTNGYVRANIVMSRDKNQITWDTTTSKWNHAGGSSTDWSMLSHVSGGFRAYTGASVTSSTQFTNTDFNDNYLNYYVSPTGGHTWEAPGGGDFVFNERGLDRDFRVESDDYAHMLFVDAGGDCVHINRTSFAENSSGISLRYDGLLQATRSAGDPLSLRRITNYGQMIAMRYGTSSTVVGSVDVGASGITYNTTSDRRLKKDIKTITDGTDKLMAMNPVTHTWIERPEADAVHGFIAQEMMDIVPEAVSGDPEGDEMMSMDYGRITPVLVAALQDAHKKIAELETRLNELEGE